MDEKKIKGQRSDIIAHYFFSNREIWRIKRMYDTIHFMIWQYEKHLTQKIVFLTVKNWLDNFLLDKTKKLLLLETRVSRSRLWWKFFPFLLGDQFFLFMVFSIFGPPRPDFLAVEQHYFRFMCGPILLLLTTTLKIIFFERVYLLSIFTVEK